jgi:hypothetical protein
MPRALSISGIVVAILLVLVFGLDVTPLRFPFGGASTFMDIGFIVAALMLGYLSWTTLREAT